MAVTRGTAVSGNSGGMGTGFTIASVTCSGSDRHLTVFVAMASTSATVTSVTFNGSESLALASSRNAGSGSTQCRVERWVLTAPSATTANVSIVTSSVVSCGTAIPRSVVDQATPTDTSVSSAGTSTAPALSGTFDFGGGGDEQGMCVVWRNTTNTFTPDAGVTSVSSTTSGSGSSHVGLALVADYDTETGKVLGSLSGSTGWGVIGVNFNEVAVGGSSIPVISAGYHQQGVR